MSIRREGSEQQLPEQKGNLPIHWSYGPEPVDLAMAPALRTCPLRDSFSEFGKKEVRMDMEINTRIATRMDE